MNKADIEHIRDEIVMATLPNVAFDGWRWESVLAAAAQVGHGPAIAQALFPQKIKDVLEAFSVLADKKMLESLRSKTVEELKVRARIREAVLARLVWLQPHKEALRESILFWAFPTRKWQAAKIVWRSADTIWDWAGDTARDYNRYTKRSLLSGMLISTTLVWLDDKSDDMNITRAFLDRRIENVMSIGQLIGRLKTKINT